MSATLMSSSLVPYKPEAQAMQPPAPQQSSLSVNTLAVLAKTVYIKADGVSETKTETKGDKIAKAAKETKETQMPSWTKRFVSTITGKSLSKEEQKLIEKEKANKQAQKDKDWKANTKKWRKNLLGNTKKMLFNNPIANFIKNHWGKLLIGLGLLFLKPAQMKKVWDALKDMAIWLWTEGPGIFKSLIKVLEDWVPIIGSAIGSIVDWLFGKKADQSVIDQRKKDIKDAEEEGPRKDESKAQWQLRVGALKAGLAEMETRKGGAFGEDASFTKKLMLGTGGFLLFLSKFGPTGTIGKVFELGISGLTKGFGLLDKITPRIAKDFIGPQGPMKMSSKLMGGGMLLAGVAMAIADGMEGAAKEQDWFGTDGKNKGKSIIGSVLGGTDSGLSGAFANMGKWALIGAGIGSFFPVIGTAIGGVIGAILGAILGWIGGERIAKGIAWAGKKLEELWDAIWDGTKALVHDFKVYLIDPVIDFITKLKDWTLDAIKGILPESVLEFFGLGDDKPKEPPPPPETKTTESGDVVEKTQEGIGKKFKKDWKSKNDAEELGFMKTGWFTGKIQDLTKENKDKMTAGINNGKLTRDMLVAMIDSGELGEEDHKFVKTLMSNSKFKKETPAATTAVKSPKDVVVTPTTKDVVVTPTTKKSTKISSGSKKFLKEIKKDIKRASRWRGKNRRTKAKKINDKIDASEYGDEILEKLTSRQLKIIGRDGLATKKDEERKIRRAARTPEQIAADVKYNEEHSGRSAGDAFMGDALEPASDPNARGANINNLHKQNAELKSGGGVAAISNDNSVTNHYHGGKSNPSVIMKPEVGANKTFGHGH
jgi:hypothetical protein